MQPIVPVAQYQEALEVAHRFIADTDKRADVALSITGHSLGGSLAQYVSLHTGSRAVVFNSAPVGFLSQKTLCLGCGEIDIARAMLADSNITNIHVRGDAAYGLHTLKAPGRQFGQQYALPSPRGADVLTRHRMETVIDSMGRTASLGTHVSSRPAAIGIRTDVSSFTVTRGALADFAETVGTLAGSLKTLHEFDLAPIRNPVMREALVAPNDVMLDTLGHVKSLYDFQSAIEKDLARGGPSEIVRLYSHTTEQLARFGLETVPTIVKLLEKRGLVGKGFGVTTLGVEDIISAAATHVGKGYADIDTITSYLDGLNGAAWGLVGLTASGGNVEVASTFQALGKLTAKTARTWTAASFERLYNEHNRVGDTLLENWRMTQQSNRARGLGVQSVEAFYAHDQDVLGKISREKIRESNAIYGMANAPSAMPPGMTVKRRSDSYRNQCVRGHCETIPQNSLGEPPEPGGVVANIKIEEQEVTDDQIMGDGHMVLDALDSDPDNFIVTY